jgi:hypothetical protein
MDLKKIKRAVFTVEAAFIVPLAAMIIAALLGYIYFIHEGVWSKAAAYEAGFYGIQRIPEGGTAEEKAKERLDERYEESVLGFEKSVSSVSDGSASLKIYWEYGVLKELFGELFATDKEIEISKTDPVRIKQLAWIAGYIAE